MFLILAYLYIIIHLDGISGWIRIFARFEENERLYSLINPIKCPSRPPEKFNVELIQLYIARIGEIIKDITSLIDTIRYFISWEDPALTGLIMIFFVFTCIYFNAEYIASLPLFILLIYMIALGIRRRSGNFKMKWVIKGTSRVLVLVLVLVHICICLDDFVQNNISLLLYFFRFVS